MSTSSATGRIDPPLLAFSVLKLGSRLFPSCKLPVPQQNLAPPHGSSVLPLKLDRLKLAATVFNICGPSSSVGITTGYGLDGPGIQSRWGARFSAALQTGLGFHPASCTMGTWSFSGVKRGRVVTLTPHPLLVPWSRKSRVLLPL